MDIESCKLKEPKLKMDIHTHQDLAQQWKSKLQAFHIRFATVVGKQSANGVLIC